LTVLTDAEIRDLRRPKSGQIEVRDKSVPGLRVRVGMSGTKSFVLRKRVAGKYRNVTIGRFSERFGLAEARKRARQILSDIELKADPLAALPSPRRRSAASLSVSGLWPQFKAAKSHLRSIGEIERVFKRHILPEFGHRSADQITRSEITRFIDAIALDAPVMARNTLGYLSSFYGWALARFDHLPSNPCRDAGRPRIATARSEARGHRGGAEPPLWLTIGDRGSLPAPQLLPREEGSFDCLG
jgi:hypothetical protein